MSSNTTCRKNAGNANVKTGNRMNRETDPQTRSQVTGQEADTAQGSWLHRWSQRKHQGGDTDAGESAAASPEAHGLQPAAAHTPADTMQPAPAGEAEEPELPPVESLDEHSDYRAFMSDRVSEELRLLALRKLFSLPQFNIRDGLNDYDDDFSSFKPLGDVVPHDMARSVERALRKAGQSAGRGEAATTAAAESAAQQTPPAAEAETPEAEGDTSQDHARGAGTPRQG